MSQYTISTLSWPVRALAKLSGLAGSREAGLALLQQAAAPGAETETDALLLLMITDNRDGRPSDALERLARLKAAHPRNRLLWLNHGAAALAAGRPQESEQVLAAGIAAERWADAPAVAGERALWFLHRGAALADLRRDAEALEDLRRGLLSDPRDWVQGRLRGRIGDLSLRAGDRNSARREFAAALDSSARGGDQAAVKETKQKLDRLKHE
jgi:tetratricopeptide (TPR) repeat protein